MSPIHLSFFIAIHLSPSLAGGVRLPGCHQLICLPLQQFICLPVSLVVLGLPDVSNSFVFPYSNSFVSQSGWSCPAVCMSHSPIHLSPLIAIHLSPSLAGGVRLPGCLQFTLFPLIASHLSPSLVWLVVSGSLDVSNSFVSPYSYSSVSQSGWWCPAICLPYRNSFVSQSGLWCPDFRMSRIDLSSLTATDLSPSLACGVRLSACLQFICLDPSFAGSVRLSG